MRDEVSSMANLNLPSVERDDIGVLPLTTTTDAAGFRFGSAGDSKATLMPGSILSTICIVAGMERDQQHIAGCHLEGLKLPAQSLPNIVLLIVRAGSEERLVPAAVLLPYLGQNIRVGRSRAASFYCNIDEYGRIFGACPAEPFA